MRIKFLILIFTCSLSFAFSQNASWIWAQKVATAIGSTHKNSIATDKYGFIYTIGVFAGPSVVVGSTTLTNMGTQNIFLAKYDSTGAVVWAKRIGGNKIDHAYGLATDTLGNIYVTGSFGSDSLVLGITTLHNSDVSATTQDIFLAKFDNSGNPIWAKQGIGTGAHDEYSNAVTTDLSGNVYITGAYEGTSLSFSANTITNTGSTRYDIFTVKYNSAGSVIWARSAGGSTGDDYGRSVTIDNTGAVIVSGDYTSTTITFGTFTLSGSGFNTLFVVKYNSSGIEQWILHNTNTSASPRSIYGNCIKADQFNNIYLTGNCDDGVTFAGSPTLSTGGSSSYMYYLMKIDPSGSITWTKQAIDAIGTGIAFDSAGNVYCSGYFNNAYGGTAFGGGYFFTFTSYHETFIAKYNSSGTILLAMATNAHGNDAYGNGIIIDRRNSIYCTGYAEANTTLSFGSLSLSLSASTYSNFLAKICQIDTPVITQSGPSLSSNSTTGNQWYFNGSPEIGATSQNYSPTSNGNYYVKVTNSSGCSAISNTIAVSNTFWITSPASLCIGQSTTLTANPPVSGGTYLWNTGDTTQSIPVNPVITTTYSVTYTAAGTPYYGTTTLTVYPLPATPSASSNAPVCTGASLNLMASAVSGVVYHWSGPSGYTITAQNPIRTNATVAMSGTYSVYATQTGSGCQSGTSSVSVVVNPTPTLTLTSYCPNPSSVITATPSIGGGTYLWNTGATTSNISVSPASTTSYTVTYTSPAGCTKAGNATVIIANFASLPFAENFESATFIPTDWVLSNPDANVTWARTTTAAGFGLSSASAMMDNYSGAVDITGQKDAMRLPKLDLSAAGTASLKFDVAYARFSSTLRDSLNVYVSANCGTTWTKVYAKGGTVLATAPDNSSSLFVPTSAQWRQETINLNAYAGQPALLISFENRSGYGQALYVDNINITTTTGSSSVSIAQTTGVNPLCAGSIATFTATPIYGGTSPSYQWQINSVNVGTNSPAYSSSSINNNDTIKCILTSSIPGILNNPSTSNSILMVVNPLPSIPTITPGGAITFCQGDSVILSSTAATSYLWSNGSATQNITVLTSQTDSVKITDTNGCSATSAPLDVVEDPTPSSTITAGGPTIFCQGDSVVLSVSASTTYAWSNGATSQNITVFASESDSVTVTDINGCMATSAPTITTMLNDCYVWPGDANHDSVVNNYDLLPIGLFYSQTGTPRATISNLWQAYASANWGLTETNGSDIKHVDCNGDGMIDNNDTLAVNFNFSSVHAIAPPHFSNARTTDPGLYFITGSTVYNAGDWVDVEIWAGNSTTPANNFYGIAFDVNYDVSFVQGGTESIVYPVSFAGTPGTNALTISKIDALAAIAHGGITKIDHLNANGFGKIADFRFQTNTSLLTSSVLHFSIENYFANDASGAPETFTTITDSIIINPLATGVIAINDVIGFTIYPNPFTSATTIYFNSEQKNTIVKVTDIVGREINTFHFSGRQLTIEKGKMQPGIYNVQVIDENKNIVNRKIVIQ